MEFRLPIASLTVSGSGIQRLSLRCRLVSVCGSGILILAAGFAIITPARAVPPNPPLFMVVNAQPGTAPEFRLRWNDRSNDETGFEIQAKAPAQPTWVSLGTVPANTTSGTYTPQAELFTVQFRVRAVKGVEFSAFSPEVQCTLGTTSTTPPTGLYSVVFPDDVFVTWADNVYDEDAYEVELRPLPGGAFSVAGTVAADSPSLYFGGIVTSGASYEMRVRNRYGSIPSVTYSGYSNTISFVGPTLGTPANLSATLTDETSVGFTQQDNSTWESGFELEVRVAGEGDGSFTFLGVVNLNVTTIVPLSGFDPGTDYEFRIRAFYLPPGNPPPTHFSSYSTIASISTIFHAPTSLAASAITKDSLNLTWTDNSDVEDGYAILGRLAGTGEFEVLDLVGSGVESYLVPGLAPGTEYEFQVVAYYEAGLPASRSGVIESAPTNTLAVVTKDGFLGSDHPVIQFQQAFSYMITTSTQFPVTQLDVDTMELPGGLNYDPGTATIGGASGEAGLFSVPITAMFGDGSVDQFNLILRIVLPPTPPQTEAAIGDQILDQGDSALINLADKFSDADTESAVRVNTTKGTVDVVLYPTAMPLTVANFMGYVSRGDYDGTVFYRSATNFVIQGGDYTPTTPPDNFASIPVTPSPQNEPGISNVRGTISLAKTPGDPGSASNDFFFNLKDNSSNLNFQNGGFPVFGRVAGEGMTVVDGIAALPRAEYVVNVNSQPVVFKEWPMDAVVAPPAMDHAALVVIESVQAVDALSYAVTGNTAPGVASAVINGTDVTISGLSPGMTTIEVTATDLDGNTAMQSFDVVVNESFAQWAVSEAIPGGQDGPMQNPDDDFFDNVGEWGFLGNPLSAIDPGAAPVQGFHDDGGMDRISVTFKVRKFTTGLTYRVLKSTDLTDWGTFLWSSNDGFVAPNVMTQDFADHVLVTVWDDTGGQAAPCFLRIGLTLGPEP